jgi:hypothetical protein
LNVIDATRPVATLVETQPPDTEHGALVVGSFGWNAARFRMNAASLSAGMSLMTRHSILARREYTAIVRLRADIGSRKMRNRKRFRDQFLNHEEWRQVRKAAGMHERHRGGLLSRKDAAKERRLDREHKLYFCGDSPRKQRVDFCAWSVPPTALVQAVDALRGERYDALTSNASLCNDVLMHKLEAPVMPENVFLCAMHTRGVTAGWSRHEVNHDVNEPRGAPQPDPPLHLTDLVERLKRVC